MFKKIFKIFCALIALSVIGTLAFRFYSLNAYPAFAEGIYATDTLKDAYASSALTAETWTPRAPIEENGDFFIHQPIYFPEQKTLFVTLRYNDSLLREWKHEGDGADLVLDVSLYADGTERIPASDYVYGHAYGIYSYRRYVFENVDLSEYTNLYLDVYHGEPDYSVRPYTVEVYDLTAVKSAYTLTAADKKALQ